MSSTPRAAARKPDLSPGFVAMGEHPWKGLDVCGAMAWVLALRPQRVLQAGPPEVARYRAEWTDMTGEDWRKNMEVQMQHVAALLGYLQERKVRVHVVFPPRGTWHDELPFAVAYRQMVMPLLEARAIPVTDMARLIPDSDFGDATHLRYSGQIVVHRAYRELALRALAEMGTELPL